MAYLKPHACEGCPFQHLSKYITPDSIVEGSTVGILAQNPGEHEEQGAKIVGHEWREGKKVDSTEKVTPQPLIGRTGKFLQEEFWPQTKLSWEKASKFNVIKCRPYGLNELPNIAGGKSVRGITVTMLKEAIQHCTTQYLRIPESIKHLMAMGEVSLYALSGEELLNYRKHQKAEIDGEQKDVKSTITEWRGWALEYDKATKRITAGLFDYYSCQQLHHGRLVVFPVVHIAALFESDKLYHATLCDFRRFGQLVRGEWPQALPKIVVNHLPETTPGVIGFDTEYTRDNELIMWSMADPQGNVYVVDADYSKALHNLPERLVVVTQNGLVDMPHLLPLLPRGGVKITLHDCMLAHALVWAGERTSLDYQLSKVGAYNRHKHLLVSIFSHEKGATDQAYLYAGLDAETTLNSAWRHLAQRMRASPEVYEEYLQRRQPLLRVIDRSQRKGIALDQARIARVGGLYAERLAAIQARVQELTGNPTFNIRSTHAVNRAIYDGTFDAETKRASKSTKTSRATKVRTQSPLHQKMAELKQFLAEVE